MLVPSKIFRVISNIPCIAFGVNHSEKFIMACRPKNGKYGIEVLEVKVDLDLKPIM